MAKTTKKEFPTGTQIYKTDDNGRTVITLKLKKTGRYTQEKKTDAKGKKSIQLIRKNAPAPASAPEE